MEEPKLRGGAESRDDGNAAVPRESEAAASAAELAARRVAAEAEAAAGAIAAEARAQGLGSTATAAPRSVVKQSAAAAMQRQHSFLDDSIQVCWESPAPASPCGAAQPQHPALQSKKASEYAPPSGCAGAEGREQRHHHVVRWLALQRPPRLPASQALAPMPAAALEQLRQQAPAPHQNRAPYWNHRLLQGRRRQAPAPSPPRPSSPLSCGSRKRLKLRTATAGTPARWAASSTTVACRRRQLQRPWRLTTGAQVIAPVHAMPIALLHCCSVCGMLAGCVQTADS